MRMKFVGLSVVTGIFVGLFDVVLRPFFPEPIIAFSLIIPAMLVPLMYDSLYSSLLISVCAGMVLDVYGFSPSLYFILLPICAWGAFELSRRLFTNQSQYVFAMSAGVIRCTMIGFDALLFAMNRQPKPWFHLTDVFWSLGFDVILTMVCFSLIYRRRQKVYAYGSS